MYYSKRKWIFFPFIFLAAIAGFSFLVMFLWNAVVPDVFHLEEISYLQALLLLVLSRIFFGGGHFRHSCYSHPTWREKFKKMTPEEREEMRKNWSKIRRSHWHYHPEGPENKKDSKNETETR